MDVGKYIQALTMSRGFLISAERRAPRDGAGSAEETVAKAFRVGINTLRTMNGPLSGELRVKADHRKTRRP